MTIYTTSVRQAANTLSTAKDSAVKLARGLQDALSRAAAYHDPNMSDEGLSAKRAELSAQFKQAAQTDLDTLKTGVEHARTTLAQYARENTAIQLDPAKLIRAEQLWRQVERQLDVGMELRSILSTADADTALAVLEFGPSWAKASGYRPPNMQEAIEAVLTGAKAADAGAWVQRLAYKRIAETTPDPQLAELLDATAASDGQYATALPYLQATSSLIVNGSADMVGAAVASQFAEREAAPTAPGTAQNGSVAA